jgi:L-fuconolactonase
MPCPPDGCQQETIRLSFSRFFPLSFGMRIDSHQHFWKYDPAEYPWIRQDWPLRRDYLPPDLEPLLKEQGLEGSIAVQARQSVEETRWLLQLADRHPTVKGVVGWVDLRSDQLSEQLGEFSGNPRLVGVRHVVQDEPDDSFMLRPDFLRGVGQLGRHELVYDLLVFPRQLPAAIELAGRFPDQPFVLDHIAKPPIRAGTISPWSEQIGELARLPNVSCKIYGLVTEAEWTGWRPADFRPYLDVIFDAFGVERLMFGSDWPVCQLAASYAGVLELLREYAGKLSAGDQDLLFGSNAARVYGLGVRS